MPTLALAPLDELLLVRSLAAAVTGAAPQECAPPVAGPPGWTEAARTGFLAYHRERREGLAGPAAEFTCALLAADEVIGCGRLAVADDPRPDAAGDALVLEVGLWLVRSVRGRGLGTAALGLLADLARAEGAAILLARTTSANDAALGALSSLAGAERGCAADGLWVAAPLTSA